MKLKPYLVATILACSGITGSVYASDFILEMPNAAGPDITAYEATIASGYLDAPQDIAQVELNAIYHKNKSMLYNDTDASSLKHTILASYFLNRSIELNQAQGSAPAMWVAFSRRKIDRNLHVAMTSQAQTHAGHAPSHDTFFEAFNYTESNRHTAQNALLEELLNDPANVMTMMFAAGSAFWNGSEASYDDPSVLYQYILGSYLTIKTMEMSEEVELAYLEDPQDDRRNRIASILGGWSAAQRHWLAGIHGDSVSKELVNAEHDLWFEFNPIFHGVTIGLAYFRDPARFLKGMGGWNASLSECQIPEAGDFRGCLNKPRFSHNILSIFGGMTDFFIKAGQYGPAQYFLTQLNQNPDLQFSTFTLGQPLWDLRLNNMAEMNALWTNADPTDDPTMFVSTRHKWGEDTFTCQTCHQTQGREWTQEEQDTIQPTHGTLATIGDWPEVTTSWYGSQSTAGDCAGIERWQENTAYSGSDNIVFDSAIYEARWWNYDNEPDPTTGMSVWRFEAGCTSGIHP